MKKVLAFCTACLVFFSMMACGMTNQQLQAEQAYYNMLTATRSGPQPPMVDIKIADPLRPINIERITIYAPQNDRALPQYVQQNTDAEWIRLIGTTISVALPWYGAYKMVGAIADVIPKTGNTTNISSSVAGNHNTVTPKTTIAGDLGVNASGNTGTLTMPATMGNVLDQTSPPTIVTQPAPVIIPTQVVNPVVVQPTVVQIPTQVVTQTVPAITPAP